jgi:hypothetical protein
MASSGIIGIVQTLGGASSCVHTTQLSCTRNHSLRSARVIYP